MAESLRKVMADARLSSSARLAYLWLRWTAKRDGFSYETSPEIAARIGIGVDQMAAISRELADAGLVRRESWKGAGGPGLRRWAILALVAALSAPNLKVQKRKPRRSRAVKNAA